MPSERKMERARRFADSDDRFGTRGPNRRQQKKFKDLFFTFNMFLVIHQFLKIYLLLQMKFRKVLLD